MSRSLEPEKGQAPQKTQRDNPRPFHWPTPPEDQRLPKDIVAGRLQEAGRYHNAFVSVFGGSQVPLGRCPSVRSLEPTDLRGAFPTDALKRLEDGVEDYGTVVVHFVPYEDAKQKNPAAIVFCSLTGSALILELHKLQRPAIGVLALLRKHFPVLHRIMTHPKINRWTTSYEMMRPFMKEHVGTKQADALVDLVLAGSILHPSDFADTKKLSTPTEHAALQTLVWSTLGNQQGPIPARHVWEERYGPDIYWDPDRATLYRFPKEGGLTESQKTWFYQIVRTGAIVGVQSVYPQIQADEMTASAEKIRSILTSGTVRFKDQHMIGVRGYIAFHQKKEERYKDPKPGTSGSKSSPRPSAKASADLRHRLSGRSGSPSARPSTSSRNMPKTPPKERRQSKVSHSRRPEPASPGPARQTPSSRSGGGTSETGQRPTSNTGSPSQAVRKRPPSPPSSELCVPKNRRLMDNLDADRRIKKGRLEHLQKHPVVPGSHPLGPQYCVDCAETPPHLTVEECLVYQYVKKLLNAPHWQFPCIACGSVTHTTFACIFVHTRCKRCSFLGHKPFECHLRTPQEWLAAFLLVAHLGRGTRNNPLGPIAGKWGFGDTKKLDIPPALCRLIHAKRVSFKAIHENRNDAVDHEAELQASWMVLIEEQQRQQRQLTQDAVRYQEQLAHRVAELLEERQRGNRPALTDQVSTPPQVHPGPSSCRTPSSATGGQDADLLRPEVGEETTVNDSDPEEVEALLTPAEEEPMDVGVSDKKDGNGNEEPEK